MANGGLRVHRVRRYRVPRYPSPWRPWGDPLRRTKRAAAMLSIPAALGAGCDEVGSVDGGLQQYCPPAYFTKAEALAVVENELAAADWSRADGCPTVPDRWVRNERYEWTPPAGVGQEPVNLVMDWLAPAEALPVSASCPGPNVQDVGVAVWGVATTERPGTGDGQTWLPTTLDFLRSSGEAALQIFDAQSYAFADESAAGCVPGPSSPNATREDAEAALAADIRAFVTGLRSDGFL
jgi:hypothetical protein